MMNMEELFEGLTDEQLEAISRGDGWFSCDSYVYTGSHPS